MGQTKDLFVQCDNRPLHVGLVGTISLQYPLPYSPPPLPSPLISKMHVNCSVLLHKLRFEMKAQPSYIQLDRSCQSSENCPQLSFVHCSYLRSSLKVTRSFFWKSHRRIFDLHALGLSEVFPFFTNSSCSCLHN